MLRSALLVRCAAARQGLMLSKGQLKNFSATSVVSGGHSKEEHHHHGQGWSYRNWDPAPPERHTYALIVSTFVWWWIFHGVFTEPEHLFGHEPFPDVTKMTDEELHIPPIQ
ncbi:NADH dehydrogenase [ubiquinone] 1 beta subcomplex subunit 2, mitochondrial [Eurytemora carolleeae]|uniref:NADH dehydrogenase [ubiquinone] 1 beta subcomplex subunit 2, mitochondrial n=1 Tax=Eurytemora carolleeae TaxID=1294199 RepID=UPI000C77117B|nr:NADH dehydrogenase [ubiquinone] 1 beta subcomplex subunit 2, mitochondrial [Eurytemora carolleeae]|eukprot:XP_023330387.1 NADH dehydrogenase [ubiquinone] 1 beta subcomplex subunit 2, mitochondrial-like [Eurytemora affinis]